VTRALGDDVGPATTAQTQRTTPADLAAEPRRQWR
jgi:hypothetical protein